MPSFAEKLYFFFTRTCFWPFHKLVLDTHQKLLKTSILMACYPHFYLEKTNRRLPSPTQSLMYDWSRSDGVFHTFNSIFWAGMQRHFQYRVYQTKMRKGWFIATIKSIDDWFNVLKQKVISISKCTYFWQINCFWFQEITMSAIIHLYFMVVENQFSLTAQKIHRVLIWCLKRCTQNAFSY